NVSYCARNDNSGQQCTEMAEQATVRRLLSPPINISSHSRQNAFIRDDISSRHLAEIDRQRAGSTLVFPLPPGNIPSQVKQKAVLFCEQEDITTSQHSEINSQGMGDNQFLSSTIFTPQSK